MFIAPNSLHSQVVEIAATDVSLSTEQKVAIKAEITNDPSGRGYAAMASDFDRVVSLNTPYVIANPEAQLLVNRKDLVAATALWNQLVFSPTTLGETLLPVLLVARDDPNSPLRGAALVITNTLGGAMSFIDLGNPSVFALIEQFATGLVSAGVITQEVADSFTKVLDPSWPAFINKPSPIEQLGFPTDSVLTMRDYNEVMA